MTALPTIKGAQADKLDSATAKTAPEKTRDCKLRFI
jgi:hypothetical protein